MKARARRPLPRPYRALRRAAASGRRHRGRCRGGLSHDARRARRLWPRASPTSPRSSRSTNATRSTTRRSQRRLKHCAKRAAGAASLCALISASPAAACTEALRALLRRDRPRGEHPAPAAATRHERREPVGKGMDAVSAARLRSTPSALVVKIGSALLVDEASGDLRRDWLDALADDVADCASARGQEDPARLVRRHRASGAAISASPQAARCGWRRSRRPRPTGQIRLAHAYQESPGAHDITVAQILLTLDDTEERRRHLNAAQHARAAARRSARCR